MTWLISLGYVAAVSAAVCGFTLRGDPRVMGRLSPPGSTPGEPRSGFLGLLVGRLPLSRARAKLANLLLAAGSTEPEVDRILGTKVLCAGLGQPRE